MPKLRKRMLGLKKSSSQPPLTLNTHPMSNSEVGFIRSSDDAPEAHCQVLDPMEALFQSVVEEQKESQTDYVKQQIRVRYSEVQRLKSLLDDAENQLQELLTKTPEQVAAMAPPESVFEYKTRKLRGDDAANRFFLGA